MRDDLWLRTGFGSDVVPVVQTLTGALAATDLARWLIPGSNIRARSLERRITAQVHDRLTARAVGVACARGQVVGAAVWTTCRTGRNPAPPDPITALLAHPSTDRTQRIRYWLSHRHPATVHHHLLALGVRPDWQCHGVGTRLLAAWHASLPARSGETVLLAAPPLDRLAAAAGYQSTGEPFTAIGLASAITVMHHPGPRPSHPAQAHRRPALAAVSRRQP